jgi:hypothetical protein
MSIIRGTSKSQSEDTPSGKDGKSASYAYDDSALAEEGGDL